MDPSPLLPSFSYDIYHDPQRNYDDSHDIRDDVSISNEPKSRDEISYYVLPRVLIEPSLIVDPVTDEAGQGPIWTKVADSWKT